MGLFGSIAQGAFSAKQASLNRKFQERMSSTAYQRAMLDMKTAGLNPMLAYVQGGASTPSGAQGSVSAPDIVGTASKLAKFSPEQKLIREQADTVEQDRTTSKPTKELKATIDQVKLDALQKGISSAQGVKKYLDITGPGKGPAYTQRYGRAEKSREKAFKWLNKQRKAWPKPTYR